MNKSSLLSNSQIKSLVAKLPWQLQLMVMGLIIIVAISSVIWPDQLAQLNTMLGTSGSSQSQPNKDDQKQESNSAQTVRGQLYPVSEVVDGDTIKIEVDGKDQTIRMIGIDTPEVVDPRKTVECFGREASTKTKQLLEGQKVKVEADASQGNSDKYSRLLRYVYLPDGQMINLLLIQQGYAFEYTYTVPYTYQSAFKAAQIVARTNRQGLWSPSSCAGQRQVE